LAPPTPPKKTPIKPVPGTMEVAEGTGAPTESPLFTSDQCVYLSRKHLLWSTKGALFSSWVEPGGQPFPDQRLLLVLDQLGVVYAELGVGCGNADAAARSQALVSFQTEVVETLFLVIIYTRSLSKASIYWKSPSPPLLTLRL